MVKKIAVSVLTCILSGTSYAAEHNQLHKITLLSELHLLDRLCASPSPCIRHCATVTGIAAQLGDQKLTQAEIQNIIKNSVDRYTTIIRNPILTQKAPELRLGLEAILIPKKAWTEKQ